MKNCEWADINERLNSFIELIMSEISRCEHGICTAPLHTVCMWAPVLTTDYHPIICEHPSYLARWRVVGNEGDAEARTHEQSRVVLHAAASLGVACLASGSGGWVPEGSHDHRYGVQ